MSLWIFAIISALIFVQLPEWFGRVGKFAGYAVVTVMGALLIYCFMPETRKPDARADRNDTGTKNAPTQLDS